MAYSRHPAFVWSLVACLALAEGCRLREQSAFKACGDDCYAAMASEVEYPVVTPCSTFDDQWASVEPITLTSAGELNYWNVSLQETVQIALAESKVIRDLGGAVLRTPQNIETHWDPAVVETDPRFGVDAALSAFDAQLTTSVFGEKNDRALNNEFFGGGTRILVQDTAVAQAQIAKRSAIGSQFALRHYIDYDSNNAPSNLFASAYNTNVEAEVRHPLLQGSGTEFNRIAGPLAVPGLYQGVLIARVNTDIELTDFEIAVRDLVSNVENAYWDLYFAYRDLDAKIAARDASLDTWRRIHALFKAGRRGGEAEKEAQAREQYYRFQEEVENALSGRLVGGTSVNNGSSGGTFRATGGVQVAERRLRMLIGLPPSDGRLMRPADEPITAPVHFDWPEITREALVRRTELRRQRWVTRRYELEHIASRNFLLPRLDAVGRYRWRGFGDDLLHPDSGRPQFDNAYADLTSGDFQEWQLGVELSVPLGYRQAAAAVRNAELQLTRSRAILKEQEHLVLHDAAASVAEFDRSFVVSQTTARRLDAAREQLAAVVAAYDADKAPLDLMLEAQRRLADAESRHFQALAEYAIAIKNVHYAKGTLLDYDGVVLSESGWPAKAYADAAERDALRGKPRPLNYRSIREPLASAGPYAQRAEEAGIEESLEVIEGEPIDGEPIQGEPMEPLPAEGHAPVAPAPPAASAALIDPAVHQELVNPADHSTAADPAAIPADLAAALDAAASQ